MVTRRRRGPFPEEQVQRAVIEWADLHISRWWILKWLVHVPNGQNLNRGTRGIMKAMGIRSGVSDLVLPVPAHLDDGKTIPGVWIELKAPDNKPTAEQLEFLTDMRRVGFWAYWTDSATDAQDLLLEYCQMWERGGAVDPVAALPRDELKL